MVCRSTSFEDDEHDDHDDDARGGTTSRGPTTIRIGILSNAQGTP
jgi:hypothetical protein